jgi:hypothetical protein
VAVVVVVVVVVVVAGGVQAPSARIVAIQTYGFMGRLLVIVVI